jgi:hypothetical protein
MSDSRIYATTGSLSKELVKKHGSNTATSFSASLYAILASALSKYFLEQEGMGKFPKFICSEMPVPGLEPSYDALSNSL